MTASEEGKMESAKLGKFGHHPESPIDAEVEVDRLQGMLRKAHYGLLRALEFRTCSADGLAIKRDVRKCLEQTGYAKPIVEFYP